MLNNLSVMIMQNSFFGGSLRSNAQLERDFLRQGMWEAMEIWRREIWGLILALWCDEVKFTFIQSFSPEN